MRQMGYSEDSVKKKKSRKGLRGKLARRVQGGSSNRGKKACRSVAGGKGRASQNGGQKRQRWRNFLETVTQRGLHLRGEKDALCKWPIRQHRERN